MLGMEKEWFTRLKEVIDSNSKSKRRLSTDAGFGPNWVQQMIKDKKEPGADKLTRLLDQFTRTESLYVMTGLSLTEADLEFLKVVSKLPDGVRSNLGGLLDSLTASEDAPLIGTEPSA